MTVKYEDNSLKKTNDRAKEIKNKMKRTTNKKTNVRKRNKCQGIKWQTKIFKDKNFKTKRWNKCESKSDKLKEIK